MLAGAALVALLFALPTMPPLRDGAGSGPGTALRLPGLVLGMIDVMLMFGGGQAFQTYVRPFGRKRLRMNTEQVSRTLFAFGITILLGTAAVAGSTWITRSYPDHAEPAGGILVAAIQDKSSKPPPPPIRV